MKYLFLMRIQIPEYPWFIELEKEYDLPIHSVNNSQEAIDMLISQVEVSKKYGWKINEYDLNGYLI